MRRGAGRAGATTVGLDIGLALVIHKSEDDGAAGFERVMHVVLAPRDLIGQGVAAHAVAAEFRDLRVPQRRQGFPDRLGPRLRVDLAVALRHLAVKTSVEIGINLRGMVVIRRSRVLMAVEASSRAASSRRARRSRRSG